jgi:hypothetical protein
LYIVRIEEKTRTVTLQSLDGTNHALRKWNGENVVHMNEIHARRREKRGELSRQTPGCAIARHDRERIVTAGEPPLEVATQSAAPRAGVGDGLYTPKSHGGGSIEPLTCLVAREAGAGRRQQQEHAGAPAGMGRSLRCKDVAAAAAGPRRRQQDHTAAQSATLRIRRSMQLQRFPQ